MAKILPCLLLFIVLINSSINAQKNVSGPMPISGKVTNSKNETVAGVSVVVKGTKTATQTGIDGSFNITVPNNEASLVFSNIGYETREVKSAAVKQSLWHWHSIHRI